MLKQAFHATRKRQKRASFTSKTLMFERLEERRVLSASTLTFQAPDGTPLLPDANEFAAGYDAAIAAVAESSASIPELFITTTDNPANHITAAGLGFDGVAELSILLDSGGGK